MKKLNKNAAKYIACSVLGVLIILYFVYQVVQMNALPYKTEIALEKTIQNTIPTTAFIVRDESYITAENANGTVVSVVEDGKRVASGDTVAVIFQNESSASSYSRINEIQKEIAFYNQLKNRVGVGTNAPSSYTDLIDEACINYINASREAIDSDFYETLIDVRDSVTAKQIAVGQTLSVDTKLASLESELTALQSQPMGYDPVLSSNPGYYIGSVDGYENTISYKDVLNLDTAKVNSLLSAQKQTTSPNVMGKLVDSFDWYILCNVPYNSSGNIETGKTMTINLPDVSIGKIECTVAFKGSREGDSVAVAFRCNTMNRDVANLRIEKIEIVTEDYSGVRINNSAIREKDGEKGVFVLRGNIVQFKKIKIIYSNDEYSIVEKSDDSLFIRQYDTVINEGVDLYDGKVIS